MSDMVTLANAQGQAFAGMSQAVRIGARVLVSGQVALAEGKVVGEGDAEAQARQCFANISANLAAAGAGLGDIVLLRCYLTDPAAYAGYAAVKSAVLQGAAPASTCVIVAGLLLPGLLMEIEAEAWAPLPAD